MNRNLLQLCLALPIGSALGTGLVFGQAFTPACKLPFESISQPQDIDDACGPEGEAADAKQRAQNLAKNSFCITGSPLSITYGTIVRLQKAADQKHLPFGSHNALPDDRSVNANLLSVGGKSVGEGTLVRISVYVLDAHYSNEKKKKKGKSGESVNCYTPGKEYNDIHMELVNDPNEDDPCASITAQISPHFRPLPWAGLDQDFHHLSKRPVRITGPLFFDSVHSPCQGGKRASPARVSLWEIHPVYSLDVCKSKTLAACKAANASVWIPFDQGVGHEEHGGADE